MILTRAAGAALGGTLLAGSLLLAGCTTGSTNATVPSTSPTTAPATTTPTSAATSAAPPSSPASTASTSPSTDASTTTAAPANTCTDLTIRALMGGAAPGQEIAAITFVNDAKKACTISGYPSVVLTLKGKTLTTAKPAPSTVAQAVQLAPGDQAESRITDHVSNCNAPLSDSITVTAPNGPAGGTLTRPFQLRNCTVTVDPVRPSS